MASRAPRPGIRPPIVRQTATTRAPMGLDDEPLDLDIDTDDLPELPPDIVERPAPTPAGPIDWVRWIVMASLGLYIVIGFTVGGVFAFNGASAVGAAAFSRPGFYLVVLFWPISLWLLVTGNL